MRKLLVTSLLLLMTALAGPAWSVSASVFEVKTRTQLDKGTLDDLTADVHGALTLALEKKELVKEDAEIFWSLALDRAGAVYAGTSHKGKIHILRGGVALAPITVEDAAVFALAVAADGTVYAGGSPGGVITKAGKAFCKTEQSYIWAMRFDAQGWLYAATGPDGKVVRVAPTGAVTTVLDSSDPHVMCLAGDSKGNLYAGTSGSGLIYRLKRDGTSEVIYDAAESEIRTMVVDEKDNLYFGTADVKSNGAARSRGPVGLRSARTSRSRSGDDGKSGRDDTPGPTPAPIRDDVTATNAIYRMTPDGAVIQLYSVRGKMILSMLRHDGKLYAGTGNKGDLIGIDEDLDVSVLEKDLEKQVLSLAPAPGGGLLVGTGYKGRVMQYGAGRRKEGVYTSEVFDAKFPARFGALSWKGTFPPGTSVEITTQSGNVATPDASWSAWSKPYLVSGLAVASPGARFIRYRVKCRTNVPAVTPQLDEVRIAYLTSNQPPRIKSVKVATPGGGGKKETAQAKVALSWQAEDPNDDTMQYAVDFRAKGDQNWRVLEEKTDKTSYTWQTDAVPDGTYELRVRVTDAPDNPEDGALTHARVGEPFVVDNTRPTVTVTVRPGNIGAGKATVNVTMQDALSIITAAEVAVDSGEWRKLLPDDRIFDGRIEKVTIPLDDLAKGEHVVTVRCTDERGNSGAGSRTFNLK